MTKTNEKTLINMEKQRGIKRNSRGEIVIGRIKLKGILSLLSYIWLLCYDWRIGVPLLFIANGRKKYLKAKNND